MKITLNPVRRDEPLELSRKGDTLTINGEAFDFSPLPDGATLPADAIDGDWFSGPVERIDGVLHITLTLPHGAKAPEETRFPEPITLTGDGPVDLPAYEETRFPEPITLTGDGPVDLPAYEETTDDQD